MRLVLAMCILFIATVSHAGDISRVQTKGDADVVVFVTTTPSVADLWVYRTTTQLFVVKSDSKWRFVNYKNNQTVKVYFTTIRMDADVVVYYTSVPWNSGWKRPSKFQNKFHK